MEQEIVRHYAGLAKTYDKRWAWYDEACWDACLPLLPDLKGKWVLDAGCGTGQITERLADEVGTWGQVVGIDVSSEMLEKAKSRVMDRRNVAIHNGSVFQVPSRDRSFDVVVCTSVLHYIDDLGPVLKEWRRVLNAGGEIVLLDWDGESFPLRLAHPLFRLTNKAYAKARSIKEVETILAQHGFTVTGRKNASLSWLWHVWIIKAVKN